MAYVTGTANSFADLVTAIQNACTANGYTLAGTVLVKGSLYADVKAWTASNAGRTYTGISLAAGNGITGGNVLTDASPLVMMGTLPVLPIPNSGGPEVWTWPVTYSIHVLTAPDEVYVEVNYNAVYWQRLCFGQSPASGNAGSGNWIHATYKNLIQQPSIQNTFWLAPAGAQIFSSQYAGVNAAPFFLAPNTIAGGWSQQASYIHGVIDTTSGAARWSDDAPMGSAPYGGVSGAATCAPLYGYTPNVWNNEAVLFPVQIIQARASAKVSLIGELGHLRYVRNDNYADGEIITLGPDRWKVFPMLRKNVTKRDGGNGLLYPNMHSGTMAVAIRYDGP